MQDLLNSINNNLFLSNNWLIIAIVTIIAISLVKKLFKLAFLFAFVCIAFIIYKNFLGQ